MGNLLGKMAVVPQAMYNGSVPNLRLDSPDKGFDDDEKSGLLLEEVCIYILNGCNLIRNNYWSEFINCSISHKRKIYADVILDTSDYAHLK